jgi:glycosyltransferase involved in cell wall biosynthesis
MSSSRSSAPSVLFVDHSAALGGAELSLLDVARAYGDRGTVLLFEDGPFRERLEASGVRVLVHEALPDLLDVRRSDGIARLLRSIPALIQFVAGLVRLVRRYDVVYANSQKALVAGALAGWLTRRRVIWHLRDILTADHFSAFNRCVAVALANGLVDRVIANSQSTAAAFVESGGRTATTVVHNGIDPAPFDAVDRDARDALRRSLGLNGEPLVGVFSRLAPWKGQHVLIDAIAALPGVHAVVVGDALFADDETYAAALHRQCAARGVSDRVHFVGFQDEVAPWMRAVDVVAHTSTAPEPFGRVVVEGMLAGRPVVASAAGGVLEIIENGVTGCLVRPGNADHLALVLGDLLSGDASLLARRGSEQARTAFSVDAVTSRVQAVIREVIAV